MAACGPLRSWSQGDYIRSSWLGTVSLRTQSQEGVLDMRAVIDDAEVDDAVVICQSMGGWTGMQFAIACPERVSCLVLSCSPAGVQTSGVMRAMQAQPPSQPDDASGPVPWNEPHLALTTDAFDQIPDRAILFSQIFSLNPPFLDVGLCEVRFSQEDLDYSSIPTLVMVGAQNHIFSLHVMTEFRTQYPEPSSTSFAMQGTRLTWRLLRSWTRLSSDSSLSTHNRLHPNPLPQGADRGR